MLPGKMIWFYFHEICNGHNAEDTQRAASDVRES